MFQKKRFVHFWLTCLKNIKENEVAIVPVSFVFGTALALFSWFCRLPRSSLSAVWQYGLWSFQTGDTKLEIFLPKAQGNYRISRVSLVITNKVIENCQ